MSGEASFAFAMHLGRSAQSSSPTLRCSRNCTTERSKRPQRCQCVRAFFRLRHNIHTAFWIPKPANPTRSTSSLAGRRGAQKLRCLPASRALTAHGLFSLGKLALSPRKNSARSNVEPREVVFSFTDFAFSLGFLLAVNAMPLQLSVWVLELVRLEPDIQQHSSPPPLSTTVASAKTPLRLLPLLEPTSSSPKPLQDSFHGLRHGLLQNAFRDAFLHSLLKVSDPSSTAFGYRSNKWRYPCLSTTFAVPARHVNTLRCEWPSR